LSGRSRGLRALAAAAALLGSTGCWEQWTVTWWPQMKWQKTVQAFEESGNLESPDRRPVQTSPPEGTVPVGMPFRATEMNPMQGETLQNPHASALPSLENGKTRFATFCSPCHGLQGLGDGPVAGPPWGKGPFVGVLPLAGPAGIAKALTDGHIFTTISQGRGRMPSYKRIPPDDRWDIVNYVRVLSAQAAPAPPPPQAAQAAPAAGATGGMN